MIRELAAVALLASAVLPAAPRGPEPSTRNAQRSTLLAGAARRIITPAPLLPGSGGVGPTHPVHDTRGDLTARAVVFRKGYVSVAIRYPGRDGCASGPCAPL